MPAIHFGISAWAPGAGRCRQLRAASSRNSTPRTILPQAMVSEAVLSVAASGLIGERIDDVADDGERHQPAEQEHRSVHPRTL
jgi:hypothetical protein